MLSEDPLVVCASLRTKPLVSETEVFIAGCCRPPLLFTNKRTEVGHAPIFVADWGASSHSPSTRFVMYGPAGKVKLWAGRGAPDNGNCERVLRLCLERLNTARERRMLKRLKSFTYSDCVNYNKREFLASISANCSCKRAIHSKLLLRPDVFRVFDAEEGQGAARLEVELTTDSSDFASHGNINIFMSYPTPPFDPSDTAPVPDAAFVRVNVTGRFSFSEAINCLDLISIAIHAPESALLDNDLWARLMKHVTSRSHATCVALNRSRELARIQRRLRAAHAEVLSHNTYARPLHIDTSFDHVSGRFARTRQCFMCQCIHSGPKQPQRGAASDTGTVVCGACATHTRKDGCPFHVDAMKTTYRKVPDSHIFVSQDGPVATALDLVCQQSSVPSTPASHCCSSCFQQNNRRKNVTLENRNALAGTPHPNLLVVYSLLFMGHPDAAGIRRRNSVKLLRRFVRIVTSASVNAVGDVVFLCPPFFRPMMLLMSLRWTSAEFAANHFRVGATWTPELLCRFRRWCMGCSETHWMQAAKWAWRHGCSRSELHTRRGCGATTLIGMDRPVYGLADVSAALLRVGLRRATVSQAGDSFVALVASPAAALPVPAAFARAAETVLRAVAANILLAADVQFHPGMLVVARHRALIELFPLQTPAARARVADASQVIRIAFRSGALALDAASVLAQAVYICEAECPTADGSASLHALKFVRETLRCLETAGDSDDDLCAVGTVMAYVRVMLAHCAGPADQPSAAKRPRRLSYVAAESSSVHRWG